MSVLLKVAMSLDGKIALANGQSKWISSQKSRERTHLLRANNQAIIVGSNTLKTDDPFLTVRYGNLYKQPVRVVMSSSGNIPLKGNFFNDDGVDKIVFVGCNTKKKRIKKIKKTEAIVEQDSNTQPTPDFVVATLNKYGYNDLLIEGGSNIYASFIKSGLVDIIVIVMAPLIFGGQKSKSWCADLGLDKVTKSPKFKLKYQQLIDGDLILTYIKNQ